MALGTMHYSGWTASRVEKESLAGRARRAMRGHIQHDRHRWVLNSLHDLGSKPLVQNQATLLRSVGAATRQCVCPGRRRRSLTPTNSEIYGESRPFSHPHITDPLDAVD